MIIEKIDGDIITALKNKEDDKLRALRTIKSTLKNKEIELQKPVDDAIATDVLQKEAKKRKEAITLYKQSGRDDLTASETAELKIIEGYLPQQMSDEELSTLIDDAITKTQAKVVADMGKVIGMVMGQTKGKADGSRVSALVKEKLVQ